MEREEYFDPNPTDLIDESKDKFKKIPKGILSEEAFELIRRLDAQVIKIVGERSNWESSRVEEKGDELRAIHTSPKIMIDGEIGDYGERYRVSRKNRDSYQSLSAEIEIFDRHGVKNKTIYIDTYFTRFIEIGNHDDYPQSKEYIKKFISGSVKIEYEKRKGESKRETRKNTGDVLDEIYDLIQEFN